MVEYTLYVDVWLLRLGCNFLFEYLLLWAAATITRTPTTAPRLSLGALVGTLHYLLYLAASLGLIPLYGLLRFLPVVVLVSLAMLAAAFHPIPWRRYLTVAGYFYAIGFVAAGVGLAGSYLIGGQGNPSFTAGTLLSVLTILLLAELGWGIVHERMLRTIHQVSLEIGCEGQQIRMSALVDTGNHLKDPLNRQSVIIVEANALRTLLPAEVEQVLHSLEEGGSEALERLAKIGAWQTRLRLIPFSSIGKSSGLLLGFRADEVKVGSQVLAGDVQPTIALYPHQLDPQGEYSALVPPHLVEDYLQVAEGGEAVAAQSTDL